MSSKALSVVEHQGAGVDVDRLTAPFPANAIKRRQIGGGRMADYIDGTTVIRRLNDATGFNWSFTVDRYWVEGSVTLALVTLTIPGMGSRQHIGVQSADSRTGEDAAAKGAITDGLKKAATLFGVGLDLYGPDYEAGEIGPVAERPAARQQEAPQAVRRQPTQGGNDLGATPQQIKFVQGIARELGLNDDQLNDEAHRVGGTSIGEISRRGASALIEWLQSRRGMADLSGPGPREPESPPTRTPSVSQSPSPRKAEPAPTPSQIVTEPPKPTTPMQRLHGAAKRRGLEHPDVHALALLWYDVESTTKLTAQQVAGFVAALEPDSDQSVSDEQLAADLFKAREAVRLNAPEPNSPADVAAIEHITSTPSTAPAPEAERRQQIEDDKDNWTAFWREARQMGFKTKDAIEQSLGHSITSMTPAQVRAELDSRQAAQK